MARKSVQISPLPQPYPVPPPALPASPPTDDFVSQDETAEAAIKNALSELGESGDAQVYVHRINERGREAYLDCIPAAEFSIEEIKRRYGGGSFKCRVYVPQDERPNLRRLLTNRLIHIEGAPILQNPPAVPAPPPGPSQFDLVHAMQEGFRQMAEAMRQMHAPPQVSEMDRLRGMGEMLTIFKGLLPAPPPQSDPMTALTAAVSLVKDLQPRDGETTEMDVLAKAVEHLGPALAEMFKSKISGETSPVSATVPAAQQARLQNPAQSAAPAPRPQQAARISPPSPQPAPITAQNPEAQNMDTVSLAMKMYMPMLIAQAVSNNDPATYASVLVDNIPAENWPEIEARLNAPEWFKSLSDVDARVEDYRDWFKELRDCILAELTELNNPADTGPDANDNPGPDTGDPAGDS